LHEGGCPVFWGEGKNEDTKALGKENHFKNILGEKGEIGIFLTGQRGDKRGIGCSQKAQEEEPHEAGADFTLTYA